MDEQEFIKQYWFSNTKIVTVTNPRDEDYIFQMTTETGQVDFSTGKMGIDQREYIVKAGGSERFPGVIANKYLDQMSKLVAQDEDKIQFIIDFQLRAQYYDQLIAAVDDLIQGTYTPGKDYLKAETVAEVEAAKEEAFADKPKAPKAS